MLFRKPLAPVATFTTAVTLILISLIFLTLSYYVKPAFSDGLFQDQLSASVGERKVGLFIKMIPSIVTTETLKKDKIQQLNLGYLIQVTMEHIFM